MKRAKYLLTPLIIILLFFLAVGSSLSCTLLPDIQPSPPPSPPPQTPAPVNPDWTLPPGKSDTPLLPSIAGVVAQVRPSVTAISTEVITYDIFNRPSTQEGAGSGWILDEDGLIVTNNHVIEGARSITVTLIDGRTFPASIVGTDALSDLAILKIDADNLTQANIGSSSQLVVGDWLVAIGNALGQGISAKEGIVSRLGVSITVSPGQTLADLVETSAAINPGNSGGPLVNMAGEVIGITSVKIVTVEVEGIGYAISIDSAAPIIQELVRSGYVTRPWLGIVLTNVDQWLAARYRLSINTGVFITEVASGSPADKAGLKPQDVIVGFGDQEITNSGELIQAIHNSQVGQEVEITFWRGDTKMTTLATLAESPPPD